MSYIFRHFFIFLAHKPNLGLSHALGGVSKAKRKSISQTGWVNFWHIRVKLKEYRPIPVIGNKTDPVEPLSALNKEFLS